MDVAFAIANKPVSTPLLFLTMRHRYDWFQTTGPELE